MKTNDFYSPVTSDKLLENIEKQFGSRVNINKYTREELEDMRNKIRTRIFQHEGTSKYNDLLTNETYQKDKAMLQLLNTRIKEMLGEGKKGVRDIKHPKRPKGTKPDFLDMDNDGNKKEPMKKALKDKKVAEGLAKGQAAWKKEMIAKGAASFKRDQHGGGTVDRIVAYDKDGKVLGGFNRKGMVESALREDLQPDDGRFYKRADDFFSQFEADWFDNEETSPDGMEIRGYIDGVNVMAWRFNSPKKISGWGIYNDSALEQGMSESPETNKAAAKKVPSAAERAKTRDQQRSTAAKKSRDAAQRKGITQDKDGTYQPKESKMKENDEFAVKKSEIPAAQRKAKGGDWKVSRADLDKEANRSKSSTGGLARTKAELKSKGMMETSADDEEFAVKKSEIPAVQRKAKSKGGDDWKVSLADLEREANRSRSSTGGLARKSAELRAQGLSETDKPSAGMTKKEKSAVVKKARAGKDIGKPGKGFEKVEKAAKKGGAKDPKAVAAAAMWKQQAKESFRRNVKMVNESLAYYIMEDEEGKAKTITAASDIVNDFTSWMQRVGQYQTKAIIELADAIRADFGVQQSEQFKQSVAPALAATLETLTQQREQISNAVAVLAGEDMPQTQMGMEPEVGPESPDMEPAAPDMMNEPGDEFGASDAAAGPGLTGREMRESKFARKLAESHSIISKLAK